MHKSISLFLFLILIFLEKGKKRSPIVPHLLTIGKLGSLVRKNTHPSRLPIALPPQYFSRNFPYGATNFSFFIRSKNRKLFEMDFFLPPHIYFGSWQTTRFGKYFLGTLGDALLFPNANNRRPTDFGLFCSEVCGN